MDDDSKLLQFKLFINNKENVNDLKITTYKHHTLYMLLIISTKLIR